MATCICECATTKWNTETKQKRKISVCFKNFLVLAEIFHPGGVLVVTLIYMTEEDIKRQNQCCYIFKCNALHW